METDMNDGLDSVNTDKDLSVKGVKPRGDSISSENENELVKGTKMSEANDKHDNSFIDKNNLIYKETKDVGENIKNTVINAEHNYSTPAVSSDPKVICAICQDPVLSPYSLPCRHQYCELCLSSFLKSKISDGIVYPKCFYLIDQNNVEGSIKICNQDIPETCIEHLLDENDYQKYQKYKFFKDFPNARECPKCSHLQIGSEAEVSMTCDECAFQYCYLHADAHPPGTGECAKYSQREDNDEETKQTSELIDKTTKRCPGCGMRVAKIGGCNHMKCVHCGVAFCWLCGVAVEDDLFPAHFQWWNPSGCANLQMDESQEPSSAARRLAMIITGFQIIFLGPLAVASSMASLLLCAPCLFLTMALNGRRRIFCNVMAQLMSCWGVVWMFVVVALPLLGMGLVFLICLPAILFIMWYPIALLIRLCSGRPLCPETTAWTPPPRRSNTEDIETGIRSGNSNSSLRNSANSNRNPSASMSSTAASKTHQDSSSSSPSNGIRSNNLSPEADTVDVDEIAIATAKNDGADWFEESFRRSAGFVLPLTAVTSLPPGSPTRTFARPSQLVPIPRSVPPLLSYPNLVSPFPDGGHSTDVSGGGGGGGGGPAQVTQRMSGSYNGVNERHVDLEMNATE